MRVLMAYQAHDAALKIAPNGHDIDLTTHQTAAFLRNGRITLHLINALDAR